MIKILALCGPSGAGKSYLEKELVIQSPVGNYTFKKLEQVTTRARRDENDPYKFISIEEYKEIEGTLIAKTAIPSGDKINYYGTILDFSDREDVIHTVVVNRNGVIDLKNYIESSDKDISLVVVMIDSTKPAIRHDRDEEFVENERKSLQGLYDLVLINHPDQGFYNDVNDLYDGLEALKFI